jgi:hypothetical protein
MASMPCQTGLRLFEWGEAYQFDWNQEHLARRHSYSLWGGLPAMRQQAVDVAIQRGRQSLRACYHHKGAKVTKVRRQCSTFRTTCAD